MPAAVNTPSPTPISRAEAWPIPGDSRDKDGVDEVGGIEGGGGCLPGPKQWVEVAAVQNGLGLHGMGQWAQGHQLVGTEGSWGVVGCRLCGARWAAHETWSLSSGDGHIWKTALPDSCLPSL